MRYFGAIKNFSFQNYEQIIENTEKSKEIFYKKSSHQFLSISYHLAKIFNLKF